jgi:CheY-like chemotaxis protein
MRKLQRLFKLHKCLDGEHYRFRAASSPHRYLSLIDAPPAYTYRDDMESRLELNPGDRLLVAVVDDDESVRESLPDLLREFGFASRTFSSAAEFLSSGSVGQARCLILDVFMPGMTGPDLQLELTHCGEQIPIIFMTAKINETVRLQVLEQGAVECLFKPFSDTALLEALNKALRVN